MRTYDRRLHSSSEALRGAWGWRPAPAPRAGLLGNRLSAKSGAGAGRYSATVFRRPCRLGQISRARASDSALTQAAIVI